MEFCKSLYLKMGNQESVFFSAILYKEYLIAAFYKLCVLGLDVEQEVVVIIYDLSLAQPIGRSIHS